MPPKKISNVTFFLEDDDNVITEITQIQICHTNVEHGVYQGVVENCGSDKRIGVYNDDQEASRFFFSVGVWITEVELSFFNYYYHY